jgi:hypothetical protein
MTYKILEARQAGETLFTNVEYNLDVAIITVEVAHFMPNNLSVIEQNIINRAQNELTRIQAEEIATALLPTIVLNVETPIP